MAGWVGVAMIVSGGILFSVSKAFPGYAALWPISGAALVLWAGNTPAARAQGSATRLLGTRLLVYLGGVSYGIYLWHWPLLTFYRYRFGQGAIPLLPGLCIMLAAIALAIVSTRLLERPVRTALANRLRPWPLIAVAAIAIAALAVPAAALWRLTPAPAASYGTTFVASADHPRAASPLGGATPVRAARLTPDLASVASESPMPEGCSQDGTDPAIVECQFGNPEGETTLVLVGGSHSAHFFPPLQALAEANGWKLTTLIKSGCRFTSDPAAMHLDRSCEQWNPDAIERILDLSPDLVITTGTVSGGPQPEIVPAGYLDYWNRLDQAAVPVLAIRDTPRWPVNPLDCLWFARENHTQCQVQSSWSLSDSDPLDDVQVPPNVSTLDLTEHLCADGVCPAVVGNVVAYFDDDHLSAAFSTTLESALDTVISQALGSAGSFHPEQPAQRLGASV